MFIHMIRYTIDTGTITFLRYEGFCRYIDLDISRFDCIRYTNILIVYFESGELFSNAFGSSVVFNYTSVCPPLVPYTMYIIFT